MPTVIRMQQAAEHRMNAIRSHEHGATLLGTRAVGQDEACGNAIRVLNETRQAVTGS